MANTRCLLRLLRGQMPRRKEKKIREALPLLRRYGNRRRPPERHAAEAMSLRTLKKLLARAKQVKLSRSERQAVDVLLIAFVTMSRVGEIVALERENVSPEGDKISIRPKTCAKTWLRLEKCVPNTRELRAAERLSSYREAAKREGRELLFPGRGKRPLETAAITAQLRRVSRKLGIGRRITSHSARKGAAVEAVLKGVPLPVVQALGGWRDLNTLQAYIGEAVRKTTSLMQLLEGTGRKRE